MKNSRRERRSPRPGPFDPGSEFEYDPGRARESEDGDGLEPSTVGPGPFDPGPEVGYDATRRRDPEAEIAFDEAAPPPEIEVPQPEVDPGPAVVPEPEPPREPEPQPPTVPEPEPPTEPEPQPPSAPEPPPEPERPVDSLEPAPWVPSAPPRRRPPRRRPPTTIKSPPGGRRPRGRAIAALAAVGLLAGGVAWATGADLPSPLDAAGQGEGATAASAGGGEGNEVNQEDPSSLAITSESGPYHPVAFEGKVDYGEAGAKFGASRYGHAHEGQDMFAKSGTPLVAVRDGVVVDRGNDGGRGNYIGIYSPVTRQTYVYLHMLKPTWLKPGDRVIAGQQIGGMGCTGSCFGTHLHFEIRQGDEIEDKAIDPLPSLKKWPQAPPLEKPSK